MTNGLARMKNQWQHRAQHGFPTRQPVRRDFDQALGSSLLLRPTKKHKRFPSRNDIIRLNQQFLHRGSFHTLFSLDRDLELHCFQDGDHLLELDFFAFLDFDFPDVGIQGSLDWDDIRI